MKRNLIILWGLAAGIVLVWGPVVCGNTVKIFYSDGVIQQGESYDRVEVYDTPPSHTTINMTGGHVYRPGMFTYDSSTVNISGGYVDLLDTHSSSIVNILGGYVCEQGSYVISHDLSTVNLYEGGTLYGLSFGQFILQDSSVFNIYGGDALLFVMPFDLSVVNVHDGYIYGGIEPHEYSTINVYGGQVDLWGGILGNVIVPETSTVNIYGYSFVYEPKGEWRYYIDDPDNGMWTSRLTGWGLDGTLITYLGLPDPATHTNINLIPEPSTVVVLGLGAITVLRKQRLMN
jgi:hypothetical protein